jgi:hypothetical protein
MEHHSFLSNKYTSLYYRIIAHRRANPLEANLYGELHHVIPKSMGGSNDHDNLIKLSAREHFICHVLLTKMTAGPDLYKMKTALIAMCNLRSRWNRRHEFSFNSRLFEKAKTGLVFSDEHRRKISEAAVRQFQDPTQRLKASENAKKRRYSEETKLKMSKSHQGKIITPEVVTCPHCKKSGGKPNMMRYHFNKCSLIRVSRSLCS